MANCSEVNWGNTSAPSLPHDPLNKKTPWIKILAGRADLDSCRRSRSDLEHVTDGNCSSEQRECHEQAGESRRVLCGVLSTSSLPAVGREGEEFTKFVPFVFLTISAGRWPWA